MPHKANVNFLLAEAYLKYYKKKDFGGPTDFEFLNKAEEAVKKGLEINPEDAPAHTLYGDILSEKGEFKKSIEEYKEAVKLAPKENSYWLFLALTQEKAEKNDEAIRSYSQMLNLNPKDTLALYYLGSLYQKTGKTTEAIETFEKLMEIDSDFDDTKQRLETLKSRPEIQNDAKSKLSGSGRGTGKGDKPQY